MSIVSVIVPIYNAENYLHECVDSILAQTIHDIEVILVDDGSTDESENICDAYCLKDNRVRVFHKTNGGISSARNLGLKYAQGEYISFIDSDDWIDINALEDMYNLAKKENSDIVICDMIDHYITDNNSEKQIYHNCTNYDSVYEVTPSASNKIFKRNCRF